MAVSASFSSEAMTMIAALSYLLPALVLYFGAFLLAIAPKRVAVAIWLCTPVAALLIILFAAQPHPAVVVLGFALLPQQHDSLSHAFSFVLTAMLIMGAIYTVYQRNIAEKVSVFLYAGSALGVISSGDWISLFFFWEIMAVASTVIIWSAATAESQQAGFRYSLFHLMGGLLFLAGIASEFATTGQIQIGHLSLESLGSWLILFGVLVNVGAFPLGAWVPDAYSTASWSGSVFLSMVTTKIGIYVLLRNFAGTEFLIWVGLVTAIHGLLYALLQIDFRRFLSYMLLSQLGVMICGVGFNTAMAHQGVIAHALSSMIYMSVLFMAAGNTQNDKEGSALSRISLIAAILSGAALAALPMTLGFVSKSIILEAAAETNFTIWVILIGINLITAMAVCKMVNFLWKIDTVFKKDSSGVISILQQGSTILPTVAILGGGIIPSFFYRLWTNGVTYSAYSAAHFIQQIVIILAAAVFFYLGRKLFAPSVRRPPVDIDYLWRYLGWAIARWGIKEFSRVVGKTESRLRDTGKAALVNLFRWGSKRASEHPFSTSVLGMWVLGILAIYLIISRIKPQL